MAPDPVDGVPSVEAEFQAQVAHAIQQQTEAVAQAQDIVEDARRDALPFLSVIAGQAKAQPAARSKSLLSMIIDGLERAIRTSASLVTLWPVVAPHLSRLIPV